MASVALHAYIVTVICNFRGTGPSPRSNHVAALYGDKVLVFGGQGKSRILNDLYSLYFETMVWTRMKTRGHHPSPRAGCSGAFYGTKWDLAWLHCITRTRCYLLLLEERRRNDQIRLRYW